MLLGRPFPPAISPPLLRGLIFPRPPPCPAKKSPQPGNSDSYPDGTTAPNINSSATLEKRSSINGKHDGADGGNNECCQSANGSRKSFEYVLAQAHIECNAEIKTESETASAIAPTPEIETESETASAIAPTPEIETESDTASAIAPAPEIETESETASAIAPAPKVDTESETPSTIAPTPEIETESETASAIALTPEVETESETASAIALMPGLCLLELAALSLHSFGII